MSRRAAFPVRVCVRAVEPPRYLAGPVYAWLLQHSVGKRWTTPLLHPRVQLTSRPVDIVPHNRLRPGDMGEPAHGKRLDFMGESSALGAGEPDEHAIVDLPSPNADRRHRLAATDELFRRPGCWGQIVSVSAFERCLCWVSGRSVRCWCGFGIGQEDGCAQTGEPDERQDEPGDTVVSLGVGEGAELSAEQVRTVIDNRSPGWLGA
jgi:hypothetical protein